MTYSKARQNNTQLPKPFSTTDVADFLGWIGPVIMTLGIFMVAVGSIGAMILADPYIGSIGLSGFISDPSESMVLSLAETGLNLATAGFVAWGWKKLNWYWTFLGLVPMLLFNGIDIYFDSLAADIWMYKEYIRIQDIPIARQIPHTLFRLLLGGISTLGEAIAIFSLVAVEELKNFIINLFGKVTKF